MEWSRWRTVVPVILVCAGMAIGIGGLYAVGSKDSAAQDVQPLAFSHAFHAGELSISCRYCHRSADASPVAGVPSMQLCMSCHRNLSDQTPETRRLLEYWETQTPVEWRRLQRLPDFVYFSHEMHLLRGLSCVQCHGRVQEMPSTPRASSFEMGWCLSCHRAQDGPRDCLACHK